MVIVSYFVEDNALHNGATFVGIVVIVQGVFIPSKVPSMDLALKMAKSSEVQLTTVIF